MKKYIGIDVSKRDFHACLNEIGDVTKFDNTQSGIENFIHFLSQNRFSKKSTLIGLESTGSYHLQLSFLATKAEYTVNVINPLITSRQSKNAVRSVKTDIHDAGLIRLCAINGAGHPFHDTAFSLALKTLVRQRAKFSMLRLQAKLRQEEVFLRESYLENEISEVNKELVEFFDEKLLYLDRKIKKFNPELQKLLQSIPGVGSQTASTCIAEIGISYVFRIQKPLRCILAWIPAFTRAEPVLKGKVIFPNEVAKYCVLDSTTPLPLPCCMKIFSESFFRRKGLRENPIA